MARWGRGGRWRLGLVALALTLVSHGALVAIPTVRAATAYTIIDLGVLPGHDTSRAVALNNRGQVVGVSGTGRAQRAFIWSDGAMRDLQIFGGVTSAATDINDRGHVVGTLFGATGVRSAFAWPSGAYLINTRPDEEIIPAGINNADQVALNLIDADAPRVSRPARWEAGRLTELGIANGTALGIDDAGRIVGALGVSPDTVYSRDPIRPRPFSWDGQIVTELSAPSFSAKSVATARNERGQSVGWGIYEIDFINTQAVMWQDGAVRELALPPNTGSSSARGINAFGQMIGWVVVNRDSRIRGVLWEDGGVTELTALLPEGHGWEELYPLDINDAGQIAGVGEIGGEQHAFLMTPTTPGARYFPETGATVAGPFLAQWETRGGLAINGYPISDLFVETLADGKPYLVQYFERVRLEYHPENADPQYRVLLGQFGRALHPADPPVAELPGMIHFVETGHNVPPDFGAFWKVNGGLAQFGFPLSEVFRERLEDGREYEVQYFERARFERHPENPVPYRVQLGQFGRAVCPDRCR